MKVTREDFKDLDNLGQCECGNWAHYKYLTTGEDDHTSCPSCHISFLEELATKMEELVREVADPALSKDDIDNMIKRKHCDAGGIDDIENLNLNLN